MTRTDQPQTDRAPRQGNSAARRGTQHHPYTIRILKILIVILTGLLLWGIVSWLISSIPLKKVRVEGLTRYAQEEVLVTSGLSECKHLSDVDKDAARDALTAFYPYIKSVRIRYAFPLGIRMDIVEEIPLYYTCIAGDYFALSEDLKVLERATSDRRFREEGLRMITLAGIRSAMLGQTLNYGGAYLEQVLRDIDGSDLAGRITNVQLGDRYHLSVICDGLYTLYLGEITSIDAKLQIAALMLADVELPDGCSATLDVSDPKKTSIRYNTVRDGVLTADE